MVWRLGNGARGWLPLALVALLLALGGPLTPLRAQGEPDAPQAEAAQGAEAEPDNPLAEEHGSWFYAPAQVINHLVDPSGKTKIITGYIFVSWVVIALLALTASKATARLRRGEAEAIEQPKGLQNFLELVVEGLFGFFGGIIGEAGQKYLPLVATFFMVILLNNWIAIVPGFVAPTSTLNMTIALALTAFVHVQYFAIKENGLKAYLKHFAGNPTDAIGWCLSPLMFPLEIVGECVKPLSLSMRLFGNIFGEDMVVLQIMLFWLGLFGWKIVGHHVVQSGSWLAALIPMHLPMMLFSLFGGFIQALVFSMLVSVYISLLTSHHEEHGHHHEDNRAAAH